MLSNSVTMKLFSMATLITAGTVALGSMTSAEEARRGCSLETLHGTMSGAWTATNASNTYLHSGSSLESFDGKGHFKWYEFLTDSTGTYTYSGTGTYVITSLTDTSGGIAITANCVAKVTYEPGGDTWTYFVAPDGSAYYWNNSQPGTQQISAGKEERVSFEMLVK